MSTFQMQVLNEIAAGHDGAPIPESKRVYFQERFRARLFDFIMGRFIAQQANGLNKAKLARRIGRPPEVINRWLGAPSNLTADTICDLLIGISGEEPEIAASPLLGRKPQNYIHLAEFDESTLDTSGRDRDYPLASSTSGDARELLSYRAA